LGVAAVAVISFVIYKKMNKKDEESADAKSLNVTIAKNPALKEGMLGNANKKLNKIQASKPAA
jgi:hypothetical protein